jgi:hypothetical protein
MRPKESEMPPRTARRSKSPASPVKTGITPPPPPDSPLSAARAIPGSLPLELRANGDGAELTPAMLFAPARVRPADKPWPPPAPLAPERVALARVARSSSALTAVTTETTPTITTTVDDGGQFIPQAQTLLVDGDGGGSVHRFSAVATDASYDFNEYVLLRDPNEDPFAQGLTVGPGSSQIIPSDPRFKRYLREAQNGINAFIEYASLPVLGTIPAYLLTERVYTLQSILPSWWFDVCAVRGFNRLNRYSRSEIKALFGYGLLPEQYYGQSLYNWLGSSAYAEAQGFLLSGDATPTGPLNKLLTVAYWEDVLTSVFDQYFDGNGLKLVDPSAPDGEYPFDPFPFDEVLFGLQVVHRQTWHLLGYARGELVKSIPLGPRESQKASVRVLRRRKTTQTTEDASSFETSGEASSTTKDTSEVINEASRKLNAHVEAEAGVDIFTVVKAKVSAGLSMDLAASSKQTKGRLNELMEKTASRMKRDTKVTVSTETEETFEETRSSELTNPNDEVAVTYLYHRLQQRYWVSTEVAEVDSLVFVPEPLPRWEDIDEKWIREHGDIIAAALLDPACAATLVAIRKEPADLAYTPTAVFTNAATAGITAAGTYRTFTGGAMPDLLASGQQPFERDYERRNSLAMDQARRRHQSEALIAHIRRNILHYMRAIWSSEDYDQRLQRYSRMRVPTVWRFVPRTPLPPGAGPASPLEVEGVFMPDSGSALPLTDVIDPIGPIGYLFNCAIYRLRDDPKLANLHQALAYLRAAYVRFAVTVTPSTGSGVTVRQVVAAAPRSFSADYTMTYRTGRGKWLIPVPGRTEGDWIEVRVLPDGSLDALGLRVWLDGTPANMATLTIRVRATGDLEDPHLRLVEILHPLPAAAGEAVIFSDDLLQRMLTVFPDLVAAGVASLTWGALTEAQRQQFRDRYHRYWLLYESGRLVTIDTTNLVLDLELGSTPILEPFKRLHRYVDVMKEYQELWRRTLDNARRQALINNGKFGDPDIEHVTLVGARDDIKDVVALPDAPDQ